MRQLLTESVLLAGLGAAFGYALALSSTAFLARLRSPLPLPIDFDVRPDSRVLAFTAVLAVLTGILFGLAPALTGTRGSLTGAIRRTGWAWGGFRRGRLSSLLVALQVTFSLVLLVASGLFIRSFQKAAAIDTGMNPEGVLMLSLDTKIARLLTGEEQGFLPSTRGAGHRAPRRQLHELCRYHAA